ncbi:MAG: YihY family inner membrane protein [Pseudomonadales bacterium]
MRDHAILHRLQELLAFCHYVVKRFIEDDCLQYAKALTYMSLFALVPIMTVGLAMFSAVPAFEDLGASVQNFVFEHFVPSTGSEVQTYLESFSEKARRLGGISVAVLGVTAYLMLKNIETSFNRIWRTRTHRKGLNNFLLYWAILTLGPVLLGSSLAMTTYVAVFVKSYDALGIVPVLFKYLPWLFTSITFTLLFVAVPNCKVQLSHAALGGFLVGASFEIAKNLFASLVSNSSYQSVYGTFATVPLFLLWVYYSWLMILAGAEFVRSLSTYKSRFTPDYSDLVVGALILNKFWEQQHTGKAIDEKDILEDDWLFGYDINREQWERLRNTFLTERLLTITESGDYVLVRDLNHFSLWDLQLALHTPLASQYAERKLHHVNDAGSTAASVDWYKNLQQLMKSQQSEHRRAFDIPLAKLFEQEEIELATQNATLKSV